MTSQSFLVSCFWSRASVPHRKWNFTFLVHQNTGKKNLYRTFCLLFLSVHCGEFIEQIIKKICHIHLHIFWRFNFKFTTSFPGSSLSLLGTGRRGPWERGCQIQSWNFLPWRLLSIFFQNQQLMIEIIPTVLWIDSNLAFKSWALFVNAYFKLLCFNNVLEQKHTATCTCS